MPNYEHVARLTSQKKVPLSVQNIKVVLLFTCPICDAYTIHKPRLNVAGHWMIDHRREPVYQMGFSGPATFVGLAPADSCFVNNNLAIADIEKTRTVIRVK